MKSRLIAATVLVGGLANSASAEGLSYGVDAAIGGWWNRNGGSGLEPACGICNKEQRVTGKLGLSVANDFGGFTGQIDLGFQTVSPESEAASSGDATNHTADVALRMMRDFGNVRAGLFMGYGEHDDYGDSDENMSYSFAGIDASMETGFGAVFGQIGRLDSVDEFSEGPKDATFIRVGAEYDIGNDMVLSGAISTHDGYKDGDPDYTNSTFGLELGLEKALGNGLSVYGTYEYTKMSTYYPNDGLDYGDTFSTVWVGLKVDLGGTRSNSRKLPNFNQWVAYNANEIE